MVRMKRGIKFTPLDIGALGGAFFLFVVSRSPLYFYITVMLIMFTLESTFKINNINHRLYYIIHIPYYIILGLTLIYAYQLRPIYLHNIFNLAMFYSFLVLFVVAIMLQVYYYLYKRDKTI
jgi:hypothetical protein